MSVVGPRNRVVYFRISEHEFERLTGLCRSVEGERSVSELARTAVQQLLAKKNGRVVRDAREKDGTNKDGAEKRELQTRIDQFQERINELDGKLEQVLSLLISSSRTNGV